MKKYPNLLLDNQLCFSLYSATNAITRYYRLFLKELGITYTQYLVLIALWEGECKKAADIAGMLKLDLPTITPILKKLEQMNLVTRKRSITDERVVNIELTKQGVDLEDQVAAIQHKVACKTHLPASEFNELKKTLNDLTSALEISEHDLLEAEHLKNCA
ncbi:transcriptional regulator, MarR family protein [Methylophilales bacterium HTCC2181]|uniref:HTH-type transcriptional regulator SarZ n=1 Tax=Methylophilales bacterium HTCC2181 TaxID=383631 RepID=A0P5Q9_9PROT|nr:transcriptional regulator, MarR family protein [Methylophilales bacterium HTCC2181]